MRSHCDICGRPLVDLATTWALWPMASAASTLVDYLLVHKACTPNGGAPKTWPTLVAADVRNWAVYPAVNLVHDPMLIRTLVTPSLANEVLAAVRALPDYAEGWASIQPGLESVP
jgi:hypothetical protein